MALSGDAFSGLSGSSRGCLMDTARQLAYSVNQQETARYA